MAGATVQLRVEGVAKQFGGVTAVDDVSLEVRKGEILSVIGPNGAGKTSLLNMVSGFYQPDRGRIVLEGTAESLAQNSDVKEFYLGLNEVGSRKSYHEVKRYRRRKRWLS